MNDLRYPIGRFEHDGEITASDIAAWIDDIERLPAALRCAVDGLTDEQLDARYRPGGWTLRQVVHHLADSHTNSYVRFKLALTEEEPTIKPYDESAWASFGDYDVLPVEAGLDFLDVLHVRWVAVLRLATREQLARRWVHPDSGAAELAWNVGHYSWHGRHHLAHITRTVEREGW